MLDSTQSQLEPAYPALVLHAMQEPSQPLLGQVHPAPAPLAQQAHTRAQQGGQAAPHAVSGSVPVLQGRFPDVQPMGASSRVAGSSSFTGITQTQPVRIVLWEALAGTGPALSAVHAHTGSSPSLGLPRTLMSEMPGCISSEVVEPQASRVA